MTRLRCAVLDDYQRVAFSMADWSPVADAVDARSYDRHFESEDELVRETADCEIVVIMRERTPFPASVLARLPALRLLITTGMRNASVDVAAAVSRGVVVCGTASSSDPPLELTWALILGLARNVVAENDALRAGGQWQRSVGADLRGANLGILGLGKIGSRVAQVGLAFGMNVSAWSQNLTREKTDAAAIHLAESKAALLGAANFVTIHLVLGERTRGLIGEPDLGRMRKSAYLVNTSRAQIVEEAALVRALRDGRIAGAGLDVFEQEPLDADHPYRTLPNVLATPHLGYVTQANYRRYFRETVEDIKAFIDGAPVRRLS